MLNKKEPLLLTWDFNDGNVKSSYIIINAGGRAAGKTNATNEWIKGTLGEMLAHAAQKGAAMGQDFGKMCNDCAFRPQPDINGYAAAVEAAANCLAWFGEFRCHSENYECKPEVCKGFLYAKLFFEQLEKST
jgi:hypothetical protein